jgi:hypothetical protein
MRIVEKEQEGTSKFMCRSLEEKLSEGYTFPGKEN